MIHFTCTQENLAQGLGVVARIATKNANLPILNNILLKTVSGSLEVSATNLEIGMQLRVRGKVEGEGALTVPARILSEYVSLIGDEKVELEQQGLTLMIKTSRGETQLKGLAAEEFPLIPSVEQHEQLSCSSNALRVALPKVLFAAAHDETRPEISGIYLSASGKSLTMVATDSYRLAECTAPLNHAVAKEAHAIVPARTMQELLRMLGQEDAEVKLALTPNQILITYDDGELVSRLIDGQYPEYQQVIPARYETRLIVPTADLRQAVRAASLFSRPGINDLQLFVDAEKKELALQTSNTQIGENRQVIEAAVEGEKNSIVFNGHYLLDGLNALEGDEVAIEMTNSASPGVLRPVDDKHYLYIIMPIKQ